MDIQIAKQIFDAHNGIMKSQEIIESRIYNRFLKRLIDEGYVEKSNLVITNGRMNVLFVKQL